MPNYVTPKVQPLESVDRSQQPTEVLYFRGHTVQNSESSPWLPPSQTLMIGVHQIGRASFFGYGNNSYFGNNTYYNGANWKAMITGAGSLVTQAAGSHGWYTFASVAADANQAVVERMRLGLTGVVSLGGSTVAPWFESSTSQSVMQFSNTGSVFAYNTQMAMGNNIYRDASNWRAITAAASCMFRCLSGGSWDWYTGGSVAADAVVSPLTQVMNLSAAGNLNLGGASPQVTSGSGNFVEIYNSGTGAINLSTASTSYDIVAKVGTTERLRVHNAGITVAGTGSSIPIESWITPTLTNSWVDYGSGWEGAAYCKDAFGVVHVRGLIKSGTAASVAFTLPSGYRPAGLRYFPSVANSAYGDVYVNSSGHVVPSTGSNLYVSINFSFKP